LTASLTVAGILVSTLGCSARPALQAVLAGLVAKDHVAILFTIVAVADGVGSAAGAVVLNWAFSLALGWENSQWLGFPFVLAAAFFLAAWAVTVFVAYRTR
jgi:ABC-type polysaccharide/polyol phosphate export permease